MEAADKIRVVEQYVEAFATGDMNIIREIYAANARVEDPVGTPVHDGFDAICAFYEGALKSGARLELTGPARCSGNAVAFPFQVKMPGMIVDIIDVFEFDEAGKVVSMKAYWGPGNMRS
ncbi:MAG: nuclear transport factor 2 family protein [Halioglobus sp.]|jgi:steroid delta-isomerase